MKAPFILAPILLLSACAPVPDHPVDTRSALSGEVILGRPLDPGRLPEDRLLSLTPEIRAYLASIAPDSPPRQRLTALIRAFEEGEFAVEYDADSTLTAAETYQQQRGNCMAFTLMMVAMARALGAEAHFNEVEVPPVWSHDEAQTLVIYRHINMVSRGRRGRRVVDFDLAAYDPVYDQRKLSDSAAFAQYYSNRGMELMQRDRREQAFLYLRKALQLNPGDSDLWSNLGALYSRFGHENQAEQSYLRALQLQPGHLLAISNLERLYRNSGRIQLADRYAKKARYHRRHNPYHLYYRARDAYEQGDYRQARTELRRALRRYEEDHRFHFLMGLTSYRLGKMEKSHKSFLEAFSLIDNPATRNAYMRKLDYLKREGR
ncbi:tetratricopeptide repeat protein [Microbulbifer halophilus]|uniref:Tetratricopeptide repeat protein n=1 Tax=Microbulbifer halophilus TaxID=453963 RepID=A0ABW5E8W8_9GAMM|nr:tetratricopeptide repeat protein [Microbulbifer halophilus]MCW8125023.1 tetratricopeptide repeat protein [Microbulbifer halophilus]